VPVSFDLTTTYLGLTLGSPLVPSSSPLGHDLDKLAAAEEAGAGAVILPSLFEEQIEQDAHTLQRLLHQGADSFVEAATYFPEVDEYRTGPTPYLRHLEAARDRLEVPVIASLNGVSSGGWTRYADLLEQAGASALELNTYLVAADPAVGGADVEQRLVDLVSQVCQTVDIPVAVKLSPWFSALAQLATRLISVGASGLVLFNRFMQPDVDLDTLTIVDDLQLSTGADLALPLRWCALLRPHVTCSIGLTSGVHNGDAAAKAVLVGADTVMVASALLEHGPAYLSQISTGLVRRLEHHGYTAIDQARGALSADNAPDAERFERAHYLHAITHYSS
jgi:dihydroorotate dehydrogenase (fumarate)